MSNESKAANPATPAGSPGKSGAFEPIALLLLSLATVGTAWCSYQATVWGGVSQRSTNQAQAASRRAAAAELHAAQVQTVDILLFSDYINARASSNETLARFYSDRFRGEAKTAFEAWLATHPFENAGAPPHPFTTNLYHPQLLVDADLAEKESEQLSQAGAAAGRTSRNYVLITVLLASALFCGGTAPKFDGGWIRRAVLSIGLGLILFAITRLCLLPAQL